MAFRVDQIETVANGAIERFWLAEGAAQRRISCVTFISSSDELEGCRPGELIVLDDDAVDAERIGSALTPDVSALLLPANIGDAESQSVRTELLARGTSVGIFSGDVSSRQVALTLSRSLASEAHDSAPPELRTEDTLQGLAETLGRLVGNSVTVETPAHDLLASSPAGEDVDQDRVETILHRRAAAKIMDEPGFKRFFGKVRVTDWPLRLDANPSLGHSGRVAMRIVADGELFGVIWVTDTARPLTEADFLTIRQAADVAGSIFVRRQLAATREAKLRAELLDEVIKGRISDPENVRTVALSIGWNLDRLQQAMVVAIDDVVSFRLKHTGARLHRTQERLIELVKLEVLGADAEAVVGMRSSSVIVLMNLDDETEVERKAHVGRVADSIVKRSTAFLDDVMVTVGLGREFESLEHLAESFRQADQAAELGQTLHGGNLVLHYDDLGIHRILYSLRETEGMIPASLQRVMEHDKRHATEYTRTLWVYLKNMGRLRQASKELNIHRNTLEYRMDRITELARIDLDDPDARLSLELGIRLLQLDGILVSPLRGSTAQSKRIQTTPRRSAGS